MVSRLQVAPISERDDGQLVMGSTRRGIDHGCQVIVSDCRGPVAVLGDEFGFAVTRQVTEADEGPVA